jgi:hypothetical protein
MVCPTIPVGSLDLQAGGTRLGAGKAFLICSKARSKLPDLSGFRHNLVAHPFPWKTNGLSNFRRGPVTIGPATWVTNGFSLHTYANRLPYLQNLTEFNTCVMNSIFMVRRECGIL